EQPVVEPEMAVEPNGMIQARHLDTPLVITHPMGLQGGTQKTEVRRIGQQALMDGRVIRQWACGPEPMMFDRRPFIGRQVVDGIDRPNLDGPVASELVP